MTKKYQSIETRLIHAGEITPRIYGAINMPIFQSSTFEFSAETGYHDIKYIRLNNTPNHQVLHQKLAALENAEAAVVAASGMAAISTAFLALHSAGDHVLVQNTLYGETHNLINEDFHHFGIAFDFIDGNAPASWEKKLRHNTRAIYVETMTNPLLQVADLKSVVAFARQHHLVSMVDNTFASPINFRPAELGFDLSLHSGTKYLNGHSDIVAGAVIGKGELIEKIRYKLNHLGGTLDPHACYLLYRGVKTLALRVHFQNQSALRMAAFLEDHPAVVRVNYPGLAAHPAHKMAADLFDGYGGMLSFELQGGKKAAERFMRHVEIPIIAPSLGGVETLLTRPATTSHAGLSVEERQSLGISDGLIRVSVGIESPDELLKDFEQALQSL